MTTDPDPRDSDSPFGVLAFLPWNHPWNSHHFKEADVARAALLMQECRVGFVRMDFIWSDLEPYQGHFVFGRYDGIVNTLLEKGIKILAVLNYNAAWKADVWNQAPDIGAFSRYAMAAVRHFKNRIRYWEIWNEPDHAHYWQPQDDLQTYGRLLKTVSVMIKSEDPTARVLMGGLSQAFPAHLRQVYEQAGPASFDIVNTHPFMNPLACDGLAALQEHHAHLTRVMAEFHDLEKPIWFTEVGCPGVSGVNRSAQASTWWLGQSPTEEQQAAWLEQLYGEALKLPGVQKIFWAFFRDTSHHFGDGVDFLGLVREDFSKKPAFEAYKQLALRRA